MEYVHNLRILPDADSTARVVRAKQLVVLSAGPFGSPAILERSGIGGKAVLERNGITQVVDLPGVGENVQEHVFAGVSFGTSRLSIFTNTSLLIIFRAPGLPY